jgi:hypothetical protein
MSPDAINFSGGSLCALSDDEVDGLRTECTEHGLELSADRLAALQIGEPDRVVR